MLVNASRHFVSERVALAMADSIPVYREEYIAVRAVAFFETLLIVGYVVFKCYFNRHHIRHHVATKHHKAKSALRTAHFNTKTKINKLSMEMKVAKAMRSGRNFQGKLSSSPGRRSKVTPEDDFQLDDEGNEVRAASNPNNGRPKRPETSSGRLPYWVINRQDLKLSDRIGKGKFGDIFMGEWVGCAVAVKTVEIAKHGIDTHSLKDELSKLALIRHPNIVLFLGASIRPRLDSVIVVEHCAHGSLRKYLSDERKRGSPIRMKLIVEFAMDIARAVRYIHEKCEVIIKCLNSSNVLVDEHLQIKLSVTYGFDQAMQGDKTYDVWEHNKALIPWTAPEILRGEEHDEKVDVFSFSIMLWELLTRKVPYSDVKELRKVKDRYEAITHAVSEHNMRPEIPETCPHDLQTLMVHCWAMDAFARPDFNGIVQYLQRLKNVQVVIKEHSEKTGISHKRKHKNVAQAVTKSYKRGPTKIPTPGGYITLHTHEHVISVPNKF